MFAGPRKSITAVNNLIFGVEEQQIVGKEISRPTKSFATRRWAEEQKMNPNGNNNDGNDAIQAELRHAHMSLLAERARVQELESQLKSIMEEKYTNQSNIIDQLRSSQDKLREQLHLVIRSKMDLCESTALEIERLRVIIAELTNHLSNLNGGKAPQINIEKIMNKYNKQIMSIKSSNNNQQEQKYDDEELKQDGTGANMNALYPPQDNRALEEQLNNPLRTDANLPRHLQPFPHRDRSRIDIRTVQGGDGITYPDPFAAVDLKYTGYKFIRDNQQWTKFTSTNISSTVFETRLGNHENIIGLEQAVLSMTKGEVARVWVPSRLGYGVHGAEPLIPPNTDLVFELTLVEIRNDFAMGGQDENDPLDPHQIAHIQQDDDIGMGSSPHQMNNPQYSTQSELTMNNLNALNTNNQQNDMYSLNQQNDTYGDYPDVTDDYPQQNTFQVL